LKKERMVVKTNLREVGIKYNELLED